jgi:hypothetical protein
MNEEIQKAVELLANHIENAENGKPYGKSYRVEYKSVDYPGVKIVVSNLDNKPKLTYSEAFEVMKSGKKVRLFNESQNDCAWIEYQPEKGFLIMTSEGLVEWQPTPTINDLQFDCFEVYCG